MEEFQEDLVLGHLTVLHLGVEGGVVDAAEVSSGDAAVTVLVELVVGGHGDALSSVVKGSLNTDKVGVSVSILPGITSQRRGSCNLHGCRRGTR